MSARAASEARASGQSMASAMCSAEPAGYVSSTTTEIRGSTPTLGNESGDGLVCAQHGIAAIKRTFFEDRSH